MWHHSPDTDSFTSLHCLPPIGAADEMSIRPSRTPKSQRKFTMTVFKEH